MAGSYEDRVGEIVGPVKSRFISLCATRPETGSARLVPSTADVGKPDLFGAIALGKDLAFRGTPVVE